MPVDATPISQIPDSFSVSNAVGKAITLKDMANRTQLDQLLVSREKEQQDQDKAVNKVLSKHDLSTDAGLNDAVHDLAKSGYGRQSVALRREAQSDAIRDAQLTNERDQHIVNSAKFKMDLVSPILEQAGARIRKYQEAKMSPVDMNRAIGPDMMNQVYELANKKGLDGQPIMSPQEVQEAEAAFQQGSVVDYVQTHISAMPQARKAIDDAQAAMDKHKNVESEISHRAVDERQGQERINAAKNAAGQFGGENGELMAALAERGVTLPAGFRSKAQQVAMLNGLRERNPGMSADEIADKIKTGQIEFGAQKKETQTAAGVAGRVEVAQNEINEFVPLVRDASSKVPRGSFMPLNKLMQMGEAQISDPNLRALKIRINSLLNAYDMLAARGGTDMEKRREVRNLLLSADSPEVLESALQSFTLEADAAHRAAVKATKVRELTDQPSAASHAPASPAGAAGEGVNSGKVIRFGDLPR